MLVAQAEANNSGYVAQYHSTGYKVAAGALVVTLKNGTSTGLAVPAQFVGFQGEAAAPSSVLLENHGLHLDIRIDRSTPIGATDPAQAADDEAG